MILLYTALSALTLVVRCLVGMRAWLAKRVYARAEERFRLAEQDCKAKEVRLGRPMDYLSQLRLLKAFERRESTRSRWVSASNRYALVSRFFTALRHFHGRRTSYVSGVLDTGLLLVLLTKLGLVRSDFLADLLALVRWLR
jgi:hypothetical protein